LINFHCFFFFVPLQFGNGHRETNAIGFDFPAALLDTLTFRQHRFAKSNRNSLENRFHFSHDVNYRLSIPDPKALAFITAKVLTHLQQTRTMDDPTQRSDEKKDIILAETFMTGEDSESLKNLYEDGVLDPIYHAKTLVLNRALLEQGMGRYQVTSHFTLLVR
jgi:hypothetical protein